MGRRRRRILFMAEAVTLSHVVRPAVLAQTLDPELYEVHLACDPRYNSLFGGLPFDVIPLKSSIREDKLMEKLTSGQPLFDVPTLEAYVEEDLRLIRELSPEVVVGDMRQSLSVSCPLSATTYVNIINAQWSPFAARPLELPTTPLDAILPKPLARLAAAAVAPAGFAAHAAPLNLVRLRRGLPPASWDIRSAYCAGDYTLYPDIPELVPANGLPPTHRYIGPILWSPQTPRPEWWDRLPADRPIVYVNLGSSGRRELLPAVLEALAALPVTVLAATAQAAVPARTPENVYVAGYLPGEEAARRSRLVVCNGGNMSAQQALAAGAPVLSVASNLDQVMFARAVEAAGAGEVLREEEVSVAAVRRAAWRLLKWDGYAEAAGRVAAAYERRQAATIFPNFVGGILPPS
jgi:UDP:flavonoid glycosyltransferase YjiC (YdhE family)